MRITAAITTLMLAGIGLAFPGAVAQSNAATNRHCVLIDNDYDIDDMMAIPLVVGNRDVAAIIQTEGYTKPEHAAGAADALINHSVAGGNQRAIAIITGGSQAGVKPLSAWPWLPFFRAMMNRSNGLLPAPARPWPRDPNYPAAVESAVAGCRHVTVLLTAPFTSWIHYAPRIRPKLRAVVITGRRLMDRSHTTRGNSFNCLYDLAACRTAMGMLDGIDASFIDLPDFPDCEGTTPQPSHCYSPNLAMVAGQRSTNGMTSGGLNPGGLAGRLRQALINNIQCSSLYTTPATIGKPCSSLSTWEPAAVASGPGGRMLLWDQSTALFLLEPHRFSHTGSRAKSSHGSHHLEPTLVNGSHADTVTMLRNLWTTATNRALNSRKKPLGNR